MSTRVPVAADDSARAHRWLAAARRQAQRSAGPGSGGCCRQPAARGGLLALAAALPPDDPWARAHATRVGALSGILARAIGLTPAEVEVVALAGVLHDIGLLVEPRPVEGGDPVYRQHPLVGAQLVAPFDLLGLAAPMIRHHHERLDGSGYPDGLRGDAIPIGARIIAVADEYDRLVAGQAGAGTRAAGLAYLASQASRTLDEAVLTALIAAIEAA